MQGVTALSEPNFVLSQENKTDRFFDGCIDNVVLNQESLNLWEPVKVEGNRSFCSRRYRQCVIGVIQL